MCTIRRSYKKPAPRIRDVTDRRKKPLKRDGVSSGANITTKNILTAYATWRTVVSDAWRTDGKGGNIMSEKLTVRWDDPRVEAMANRGMKAEGFETLSDYIRAAIIRDRIFDGDKDAIAIAKENIGKYFRGELKRRKVKIEIS